MKSNTMAKTALVIAILAIVGVIVIVSLIALAPEEIPVARSYQCDVYTEQGCGKLVVASGGEIEVQSGGTADFQSGATVGFGGASTFANGSAAAPSIAFTSDTDTGMYRVGANNLGLAASATLIADLSTADGLNMNTYAITNTSAVDSGDVTASDDVAVGDQLTVGGLTLPSFTNAVITDGDTITPAYTTYALDTTGDVTITLAAVGTEGQELVLVADDANTITINDTNIRAPGGGTITMTAYYIVGWRYQDSEWLMQYRSTNQ